MPREHNSLRRQAIQITSQLPDNTADALAVLNHARDLVIGFLDEPEESRSSDNITAFPASSNSR
jgi:hypothetical protein